MSLQSIIISLIIFSMAIAGMGLYIQDLSDQYNVTIEDDWADTYNQLDSMSNITDEVRENVEGSEITTATAFETMSSGGLASLKLVYHSITSVDDIFEDMIREIGLPVWVYHGFLAIFITIISFILLGAIFKVGL